jgi:DNA-binding beta-propeller fold protein YncE
MSIRSLALFCCILCHSRAAETELGGPLLGFFFDPANGLQPIQGLSGALTVGAPADLQGDISNVVISPQQDYALAAGSGTSELLRVSLGGRGPISTAPLGIQISGADLVALSPTGSVAALYDRTRSRVQVIAGLPDSPTLAREFDLSTLPGVLTCLAVADGADYLLAGFGGGEQEGVAALGPDGTVRVLPLRRATSASFLSGSGDVLISDGPASEVYLVKDPTGLADTTLLAAESQGISNPLAVAASKDGQRAFIASSGSRNIAVIELASGTVSLTPCACVPGQLAKLNGNAVFRVTEPAAGPIWLFDGDAGEPRMVFVPPYRPVAQDALP